MAESRSGTIVGLKNGHDGAVCAIQDGKLTFSYEAEKDSNPRYSPLAGSDVLAAAKDLGSFPDAVAIGGWHKTVAGGRQETDSGYFGITNFTTRSAMLYGHEVTFFSSSHERSHIFCGVGMSGLDPELTMAVLVWEGVIGAFYRWNGSKQSILRFPVMSEPGARFAALLCIADKKYSTETMWPHRSEAGKLMAIAGLADEREPDSDSRRLVNALLEADDMWPDFKSKNISASLANIVVPSEELARAARHMSEGIYKRFERTAETLFSSEERLPLVIAGGCGLNCDWNTMWRNSGIFSTVFVPPCANDSGSAIGTAIDAQVQVLDRPCNIEWDVYSGQLFVDDESPLRAGWRATVYDPSRAGAVIGAGEALPWVQGRCEIGPRALGNRSLLARATDVRSRDLLNRIKQREAYRPIAPVCIQEKVREYFDADFSDPYMLYFRTVLSRELLPAVTHADGSARLQTVDRNTHAKLHELLVHVNAVTGVPVACNTSLNFPGLGFINRTSDLLNFCEQHQLRFAVVGDVLYERAY
jgi:hydroxymethyl cephem carbamoyltransferase